MTLNNTVERGDMKELKFWTAAYAISRQSVQLEFFTEIYELAMVFFNIINDQAYFELYLSGRGFVSCGLMWKDLEGVNCIKFIVI